MSTRQTQLPHIPSGYASQRGPTWSGGLENGLQNLESAWRRSQLSLQAIQSKLEAASLDPRILTIAISGSLGRMEQVATSDGDILVVLRGDGNSDTVTGDADRSAGAVHGVAPFACRAVESVWAALRPLKLPSPAAAGIFASASNEAELLDVQTLGQVNEDCRVFGHRIQVLLDAQPIFNSANFDGLAHRVAARYASGDTGQNEPITWDYLRNDLIRYYRCLANDAIWQRRETPLPWRQFQLKVRYSRSLLYAGLMSLLGESLHSASCPIDWLVAALKLTPLERLQLLPDADKQFAIIARAYDRFLARMHDQAFHEALAINQPGQAYGQLSSNPAFGEMAQHAVEFQRAIMQLWQSQRGRWNDAAWLSMWF